MALLDGVGDILSDVSAFSNPFGTPSKGQWNLSRGIFTNAQGQQLVFFYETKQGENPSAKTAIDQTQDTGGRRLAIYEYPYLDGQQIDDLGRKGETFTFNIVFHGINYQEKFREFIDKVVNSSGQGVLLHPTLSPVRGGIATRFRDYEYVHTFDYWNAIKIKATFVEDSTGQIKLTVQKKVSTDSALRSALQTLTNAQAQISANIFAVGGLLLLPGALLNSVNQRLTSLTGQFSRLLGQLAATFSSNATIQALASQSLSLAGGISTLTVGTATSTSGGKTTLSNLPPVYQVGFDPTTQTFINSNVSSFVNSNQISTSQAVFFANQARQAVTAAINEITQYFGNDGYDIVLQYRQLANSIQEAVEASISANQTLVTIYVTPSAMSLRIIAKNNGLTPDRQNDIEALNPYIGSVNLVPANTMVTVPAS